MDLGHRGHSQEEGVLVVGNAHKNMWQFVPPSCTLHPGSPPKAGPND